MGTSDFDKANMQAQHNLGLEWDIYVGTVDNLCGAFRETKAESVFRQGKTLWEPLQNHKTQNRAVSKAGSAPEEQICFAWENDLVTREWRKELV